MDPRLKEMIKLPEYEELKARLESVASDPDYYHVYALFLARAGKPLMVFGVVIAMSQGLFDLSRSGYSEIMMPAVQKELAPLWIKAILADYPNVVDAAVAYWNDILAKLERSE